MSLFSVLATMIALDLLDDDQFFEFVSLYFARKGFTYSLLNRDRDSVRKVQLKNNLSCWHLGMKASVYYCLFCILLIREFDMTFM